MYSTPPPEREHILIDDPRRTDRAKNFGVRALQTKPGWVALAYIPPWPAQLVATGKGRPAFFPTEMVAKLKAYQKIIYVLNRQMHEDAPVTRDPVLIPRITDGGRHGPR